MSAPGYLGTAVPVFPADPNWADGLTHSLAWRTDVTEALSTAEDRAERYPRPLNRLNFSILTRAAVETAYLRQILDSIDDMPVGVPFWPMRTKLTAAPSGVTLTVDATDSLVWDGVKSYALLWRNTTTWEIVKLVTVASGTITLDGAPAGSWVAGDTVVPLLFGTVGRGEWAQVTDECASLSVEFSETFNGVGDLVTITTATLPVAHINVAYSQALAATGGTPPYVWNLHSGTLPVGIVLPSTGIIAGTSTAIETCAFQVRVVDEQPMPGYRDLTLQSGLFPDSYAGLIGWWAADSFDLADSTAVGGTGKFWTDLSGNSRDLKQSDGPRQPLFRTGIFGAMPGIQFTGSGSFAQSDHLYLDADLTFGSAQTVIVVYQQAANNDGMLLSDNSLNRQIRSTTGATSGHVWTYDGYYTATSNTFAGSLADGKMMTWRVNGVNWAFFEDLTPRGSYVGTNPCNSVTPLRWLGVAPFGNGFTGHIAEVCLYDVELEDADLIALYNGYFKPRWGLP